jgi:hypothetical protein
VTFDILLFFSTREIVFSGEKIIWYYAKIVTQMWL